MKFTAPVILSALFLTACAGSETVATGRNEGESTEDTSRPTISDGDVTDSGTSGSGVSDTGAADDTTTGTDTTPGTDTTTGTDTSTAICGDSVVDAGEECDDGNRRAGDGCSFNCTIECGAGNDNDFDGVCNADDICAGFDDNLDRNGNGIPDGCDASTEVCDDNLDNDRDGATDCIDTECASLAICTAGTGTETNCSDGRDNDSDFLIDCNDPDCDFEIACFGGGGGFETSCTNGVDDDGDFLTDCIDDDCDFDIACFGGGGFETNCSNGIDDDGDFDIDCIDFDCDFSAACSGGGGGSFGLETSCSNFSDDDADGLTDCDDGDCIFDASCPPPVNSPGENCANGVDDDSDVAIDCDDAECQTAANCLPTGSAGTCADPFALGGFGHYNVPPSTTDRQTTSCGPLAGNDRVIAFTSPVSGPICVTALGTIDDIAIEVRTTCNRDTSAVACDDDSIGLDPVVGFTAVAGTTYYIIYDAYFSGLDAWAFYNYLGPCL